MSSLNFKGYRHTKRGWGEEKQQIFGRAGEQLVAIRLLLLVPGFCFLPSAYCHPVLLAVNFSTKFPKCYH